MGLNEALKQIGLTEAEINTFSALLSEANGASVLQLSRKLNLPRTTIYGHLDALIEKGLVKKGLNEKGTVFFTEKFDSIVRLFEEKENNIKTAKKEVVNFLNSGNFASSYNPKFIVFDNPKAAELIFRDILITRPKETFWFWPIAEMLKTVPAEVFENFHKERVKRNIYHYVLWPENKKVNLKAHPYLFPEEREKSLRTIKILPEKIDYLMGYGIYGNKVAFISTKKENYGFIIDSQELNATIKNQFDYFWKISSPYKGK